MPMYKRVMVVLTVILLLIAAGSFYEYRQNSKAVDLSALSVENGANVADSTAAVYVTGEVERPGVVYVAMDGRVGDAINQCGGLLPTADAARVNMAAAVKDGMEIRVSAKKMPVRGSEEKAENKSDTASGTAFASKAAYEKSANQDVVADAEMVNINTADADGLKKLKGIGPAMAQRIIDYREANGAFQSPEDLQQVKGIGKEKFAKIKDQIAI